MGEGRRPLAHPPLRRRRPRLAEHPRRSCTPWATRIAEVGHLPLLGTIEPAHAADAASRTNSAQRVRALHDAFTVPPALAAQLSALPGPVLLVDDLVDSGWTMAIAARLLRRAGAPAVLPFALALSA